MLKDILISLGANLEVPASARNPLGRGHLLHQGLIIQCQGLPGADPDVLDKHPIGVLIEVPADGREAGVVPTERADEAVFVLDSAQEAIDPTNPVCQVCGQPIERIA